MGDSKLFPLLILVVLAGVGLRLAEANNKSLWLDELHTLEIAASEDAGGVVDRLRPDFHAPLHFLTVHALGDLDPHRSRLVSAAIGLLALLPLLLLARDGGLGIAGRIAVAAGVMLLPFQLRYGVELRPYAWLQLFSAICAWAAFATRSGPRLRFAVFALATAAGLYTHYAMSVAVVGIGVARLFVHGRGLLPLWQVVVAGTLGVIAFLPWVMEVESWIFEDPSVMTRDEKAEGAAAHTPQTPKSLTEMAPHLMSTPARMVVPSVGTLGGLPSKLVLGGAAIAGLALLLAAALSLRRSSEDAPAGANRTVFGALLAAAAATTIMALACWYLWNRIPLQYFALSAWGWPLLLGALVNGAARRGRGAAVLTGVVTGLLLMGSGHGFGAAREDLRGGVAKARELSAQHPGAITAILRQPDWYSHAFLFQIYGGDLKVTEPTALPPGGDAPSPVIVVTRNAPPLRKGSPDKPWRSVVAGRQQVGDPIRVDRAVVVYVYQ